MVLWCPPSNCDRYGSCDQLMVEGGSRCRQEPRGDKSCSLMGNSQLQKDLVLWKITDNRRKGRRENGRGWGWFPGYFQEPCPIKTKHMCVLLHPTETFGLLRQEGHLQSSSFSLRVFPGKSHPSPRRAWPRQGAHMTLPAMSLPVLFHPTGTLFLVFPSPCTFSCSFSICSLTMQGTQTILRPVLCFPLV